MAAEHQGLAVSRRRFMHGAGVAGLGLLAGCGGFAPAPRRLGYLSPLPPQFFEAPFWDELQMRGWREGQNLHTARQFRIGEAESLPRLAAELVAMRPDVISVILSTPAVLAVRAATTTIPIVIVGAAGARAGGADLAPRGSNVTGVVTDQADSSAKRVELLAESVPGATRVGVLWNAANPAMDPAYQATQAAAQARGLAVLPVAVQTPADLRPALGTASRAGLDGLVVLADGLVRGAQQEVLDFAVGARLPTIYAAQDFVNSGGLIAYGPDLRHLLQRGAQLVDGILRGTKLEALPVERVNRLALVINLQAAQAIGLTIPSHVLLQATEVIQ